MEQGAAGAARGSVSSDAPDSDCPSVPARRAPRPKQAACRPAALTGSRTDRSRKSPVSMSIRRMGRMIRKSAPGFTIYVVYTYASAHDRPLPVKARPNRPKPPNQSNQSTPRLIDPVNRLNRSVRGRDRSSASIKSTRVGRDLGGKPCVVASARLRRLEQRPQQPPKAQGGPPSSSHACRVHRLIVSIAFQTILD